MYKKLFIEICNRVHNNKYEYNIEQDDIKTRDIINIICTKHGEFKQKAWTHKNRSNNIHNSKYRYSNFTYDDNITVDNIMKIECPIHGEFTQRIKNHLNGVGCPYCKESKGERFIESVLIENGLVRGVDYIRQYKFEDCKNKKQLPFDFYLIKYTTCIEYDGDQHDKIINFFGGFKEYEKRKINDNIKSKYCIDNGITLLRFSGTNYSNIKIDIIRYLEKNFS